MRRASVSVASNIAEGQARRSSGEFKQFLGMASGSLAELQTQIIIAQGLFYANEEKLGKCEGLSIEVSKMLAALRISREGGKRRE